MITITTIINVESHRYTIFKIYKKKKKCLVNVLGKGSEGHNETEAQLCSVFTLTPVCSVLTAFALAWASNHLA